MRRPSADMHSVYACTGAGEGALAFHRLAFHPSVQRLRRKHPLLRSGANDRDRDELRHLIRLQPHQPRTFNRRDMNEDVLASAAVRLNEAITLLRIEPLHRAARHRPISIADPKYYSVQRLGCTLPSAGLCTR